MNLFCVKHVYSSERTGKYKLDINVKSVLQELIQLYDLINRLGNNLYCANSWRRDKISCKERDIKGEIHCCIKGL